MTTFGLIDANNFYASSEIIFNLSLRNKALSILSNNDGCTISRNDIAKAPPYNIKMGDPYFKIKDKFKPGEVVFLSSNYCLYGDMSDRFAYTISTFSSNYERYSCDEVFVDWTGFEHRNLTEYGHELKNAILYRTGLPVCVGIAPNKLLAKLSNFCAKKRSEFNGVCNFKAMPPKQIDEIMAFIPVEEVWGIGRQLSVKLNHIGIYTVLDLKLAHRRTLREKFSVVMSKVIGELNGEQCFELEEQPPAKQNIASTRSFGIPVRNLASLKESVTLYTSQAAEKARNQGSYANSITVFIQTSPFSDRPYYGNSQTVALPSPSNDSRLLVRTALWILNRIYRPGFVYQKAGIILNHLVPVDGVQQDIFFADNSKVSRSEKLMAAMDAVNGRYGRQTLKVASEGFKTPWKMKQQMLSPEYTTDWDGIIKAH